MNYQFPVVISLFFRQIGSGWLSFNRMKQRFVSCSTFFLTHWLVLVHIWKRFQPLVSYLIWPLSSSSPDLSHRTGRGLSSRSGLCAEAEAKPDPDHVTPRRKAEGKRGRGGGDLIYIHLWSSDNTQSLTGLTAEKSSETTLTTFPPTCYKHKSTL